MVTFELSVYTAFFLLGTSIFYKLFPKRKEHTSTEKESTETSIFSAATLSTSS